MSLRARLDGVGGYGLMATKWRSRSTGRPSLPRTLATRKSQRTESVRVRRMRRTAIYGRIDWAAAEARCRSVAVRVTSLTRRCQATGEAGCLLDEISISSSRTNDRSWMTGLGQLAMDGVAKPERPDQTEKVLALRVCLKSVQNGSCRFSRRGGISQARRSQRPKARRRRGEKGASNEAP
jgi:hypothetical protein